MNEEQLREDLQVTVMEDYIRTASYGHFAVDKAAHNKEMRDHFDKLVKYIIDFRRTGY